MPTINQTPEQIARDHIDKMLETAGWVVQIKEERDWNAGPGIAVTEVTNDTGRADYVLFVDQKAVGIIEAKPVHKGQNLTTTEQQSQRYAESKLKHIPDKSHLHFIYESTGIITYFRDLRDPKPRSREVFNFHRPSTIREWIQQDKSLAGRLHDIPALDTRGLRDCQINAITNLDASFRENKPRALIQMATGSGKTYTAITFIYRLLKFAKAKRVLFLVDTKNLGEQAEQEFMGYTPSDDNRKFTELYNVQRLNSGFIAPHSKVCISTIQRMYSILKDEPMDEDAEKENPAEKKTLTKEPLPVVYNEKIPPEHFDFILIDECHRSIYNLWQQVLDYFDAYLIGLTATPDKRTFGFFKENVVSEYDHEKAVADGVNVGHDVFLINTRISKQGETLKAEQQIEKRDKLSRKKRWAQQDEDEQYSARQLDRDIVNPSQIRTIIRAFKNSQSSMFPGRDELPKTLIFAKTDSHADDIIRTAREEFGEGNDFCKKITYKIDGDPKSVLSQFRNNYNPRIAVTVDMIATGTDIKPLECLLFMRDVKSKNYFEQMKGRGTRTLGEDDLKKVTPSATSAKTHFVIVDAIGVTKSVKTESRPLDRKPTIPLKDLLEGVLMNVRDEDTVTTLASRLSRLNQQLTPEQQTQIAEVAGQPLSSTIKGLLNAYDPDVITQTARTNNGLTEEQQPSEEQCQQAQEQLTRDACNVFTGKLNNLLENIRKDNEQTIDVENLDELEQAEWAGDAKENAEKLTKELSDWLQEHKDEITALSIFYDQPHRRREITFDMINDLLTTLKQDRPVLAPVRVWQAFAQLDEVQDKQPLNELTALVALIRRVCGIDGKIDTFGDTVNRNFKNWIFKHHQGNPDKFTEEQMDWLRMIRDHISSSFHFERDDLDYSPFNKKGGLGQMYHLFGEQMDGLIDELNEELVA
ncbi:DEAD/DEAH box helicase family protein [Endozoicomonas sp. SESOKO2]|uniref:type I restriction endonuclease subunit R n=1 Tax=Endozoicomonas sp. SESOKO2 TaxID=2828743 RepID=UPI0021497B82|nr:DEAD/DEAH box helicase family protein [Endozoicomonas sp. SESOKO2]